MKTLCKTVAALSLLGMGGCTSYHTAFDCPVGQGLPCASLSTVNKRLDAGDLLEEPLQESPDQPLIFWADRPSAKARGGVSRPCPTCVPIYWKGKPS